MKQLIVLCLCVMTAIGAWAREHTVQRGETLESIAKNYRITVAQLVEANPKAADLFYVGLKLNIPEATTAQTPTQAPAREADATQPTDNRPTNNNPSPSNDNEEVQGPGWDAQMELSYGFLTKPKGASGSSYTYGVDLAMAYWFTEKKKGFFASAGLGYNSANYRSLSREGVGHYNSFTTTSHFVTVPIKAGFAFCTDNKNFGVTPFIGSNLGLMVKTKNKYKEIGGDHSEGSAKTNKVKFTPDFRIGAMFRIYEFNVGAFYSMPITKDTKSFFGKDAYVGVSLGFGF